MLSGHHPDFSLLTTDNSSRNVARNPAWPAERYGEDVGMTLADPFSPPPSPPPTTTTCGLKCFDGERRGGFSRPAAVCSSTAARRCVSEVQLALHCMCLSLLLSTSSTLVKVGTDTLVPSSARRWIPIRTTRPLAVDVVVVGRRRDRQVQIHAGFPLPVQPTHTPR